MLDTEEKSMAFYRKVTCVYDEIKGPRNDAWSSARSIAPQCELKNSDLH